ncbi:hypothetical protein IGL91_002449 [Enterococcus sp. DIV2417]
MKSLIAFSEAFIVTLEIEDLYNLIKDLDSAED